MNSAAAANAPDSWDQIWKDEGRETWRAEALATVYGRISRLTPKGSRVVDLGGGVGLLASRLVAERECEVLVVEHSKEACRQAREAGHLTCNLDVADWINAATNVGRFNGTGEVLVATEVLEHLDWRVRDDVLRATSGGRAFFSVPNNRLGPDEEPQHTIKWTALEFLTLLRRHFKDVRVECLGPEQPGTGPAFLLGICGFPKPFKLSVTLPVRDEADDIERVLASFRGVADEMVIGIDPRTTDRTREIAGRYAETVFDLVDPEGRSQPDPPIGEESKDRVHFSWCRNQCMDRCTGDWIFMSEGHEHLVEGEDTLLALDKLMPRGAMVGAVWRTASGQRWAFPWLCRNDLRIRYKRNTHNFLDFPDGMLTVRMPTVRTLHERSRDREAARAIQRSSQNRLSLMDDWVTRGNDNSLFYLATEWRGNGDKVRAIDRLREYISVSKNGSGRYQARLVLAKELAAAGELAEARTTLLLATSDDWSRTEHWLWLGDLAYQAKRYEEALQFYRYSATLLGEPPFSQWWIDESSYSYLPAERLAMTLTDLGRYQEALNWAEQVLTRLPPDSPVDVFEEVRGNIVLLQEALNSNATQ